MKVACRFARFSVFALLVSLVVGCGGGGEFVAVSGSVTLDGNPLDLANVTFYSSETEDAFSGLTDAEGKYNLRAQPGDYKVAISKYEGEKQATEMSEDDEAENLMAEFEADIRDEEAQGKELIPERFSDMAVTELKFTVPSGGTQEANFMNLTSR